MSKMDLYKGDCLTIMDELIAKGVVVDAIITDVPYQTTACDWDFLIPFNNYIMVKKGKKEVPIYEDEWVLQQGYSSYKSVNQLRDEFQEISKEGMWQKLNKLIKPNGAIVLFGSEPFSSALRMSNIKNYKYDWYWKKTKANGFQHSKNRPMRAIETVSVFSNAPMGHRSQLKDRRMEYNPQGIIPSGKRKVTNSTHSGNTMGGVNKKSARPNQVGIEYDSFTNFPNDVLEYSNMEKRGLHPTQKPVALMEYLIKTYTNENETVLDFTMGSGTTILAAKNLNRRGIGIEMDDKYFDIAKKRIEEAEKNIGDYFV